VKKRARTDYQVGDALSDAVKDEEAFNSIIYALEADPMILLFRLRAGIASNAEQALAADLIEGKKKPKKPMGGKIHDAIRIKEPSAKKAKQTQDSENPGAGFPDDTDHLATDLV
jgi:hypothetical protein